jgi:hypothetical protein
MQKRQFDPQTHRPNRQYDWMDLEVGEGYDTPQGGRYARMAREYCLRRGQDRTFSQKTVHEGGEKKYNTYRTQNTNGKRTKTTDRGGV